MIIRIEDIKNAIVYIRSNFEKKLSLDGIAQAVYVDKFQLSREFKKLTGKTVVEYINDYRCRRAAEYLSSVLAEEPGIIPEMDMRLKMVSSLQRTNGNTSF